ncbi:hypothetical protein OSTOST_08382, partial [Ostertagia ostertagi]
MRRARDVVVVVVVAALFGAIFADDNVVEFSSTTTSTADDADVVSVYRLLPRNHTQFNVIQRLYDNSTLNFWKTAKNLNGFWDVMVDEKFSDNLLQPLNKFDIEHIKTIDDVQ